MNEGLSRPILYSFRRCPYAMRARMAIQVSQQTCELREVILRDKPPEMVALSQKGTVPVLQLEDGTVIDESIEVMEWALMRNDPQGWQVLSVAERALAASLIEENDGSFKHHLDRYKYANRYEGADALEHRAAGEVFLTRLEERLGETTYLVADRLTYADYAIAPFIRQFANTDRDWFDSSGYIHLQAWLEAILTSDIFLSIMKKYPQWRAGDEITYFANESPSKAGRIGNLRTLIF